MAQSVRVRRIHRPFVKNPAHIASSEPATFRIQEKGGPRKSARHFGSRCQPVLNGFNGRKRHRDPAFFTALTPHRDDTALEINTVNIKIAQFAHTQAASVQHFK
jgi:hypothetical protein